jgi:AraC family transcriptional regulator
MSEPKVIDYEIAPTTVAGVSGEFIGAMAPDSDAHTVIPQLWIRLMDSAGDAFYRAKWSVGIMSDVEGGEKMNYMAAMRLTDMDGGLEGLDVVELLGGRYAACEHVGSIEGLGTTTKWFYGEYLPNSGFKVRNGNHLEIYDERFNPDSPESPDSVILICAPVHSVR